MRVRLEGDGREIDLDGPPLARGGEASLHALPGAADFLVKLYHRPTDERTAKLAVMLAAPPAAAGGTGHRAVAWPVGRVLAADGGGVVGCLVPRVEGACLLAEVYNPRARLRACPTFHYGSLVRVARNLAAALRALHGHGCVVGDLNESNVLVAADCRVTLVDADSFQLPGPGGPYRCRVGKPEYTPPELQGADFAAADRGPEHDAFALAVLVFQLMMQGLHPFAGMYTGEGEPPAVPQRIAAGHWPYAWGRDGPFEPIPYAPPWAVLPPPVQELLTRCFEDGHESPQRRPDAAAWQQALDESEGLLETCPRSPRHRHPRGLDVCPWCALARQQDQDPFPAPGAARAEPAPPALALGPDDPLPPPAEAEPGARPAAAVSRRPWLVWGAAGAVGAVVGLLATVWRARETAAGPPSPAVVAEAPSEPAPGPAPAPAPPAVNAEAARAERVWREAVRGLQQAWQDYNQRVADYNQLVQDHREGRITAAALKGRAQALHAEAQRLKAKQRQVRELARVWEQARQAGPAGP